LGSYPANLEATIFGDEIWTAGQQPVLCAARRCTLCVPSCWKMNMVDRWRLL